MKKITTNTIAHAFAQTISKNGEFKSTHIPQLVNVLRKNKLYSKREKFYKELKDIFDTKNGILNANIITRNKLGDKEKNSIKEKLENIYKHKIDKINLIEKIDESVIGGIKIKVKDEVWDFTVGNRLKQLSNLINK